MVPERIIEMRRRRAKVEELLMKGIRNPTQLATRFGVDRRVIEKDVRVIMDRWANADPDRTAKQRELRVRQLEHIITTASDSFEKSKKGPNLPCQECKGSGVLDADFCDRCNGTGVAPILDLPGDPSWLAVIVRTMREVNLLEGNHAPKTIEGRVAHAHAHLVKVEVNPYDKMPTDALLQARAVLEQLKEPEPDVPGLPAPEKADDAT